MLYNYEGEILRRMVEKCVFVYRKVYGKGLKTATKVVFMPFVCMCLFFIYISVIIT